MPLMICIQGIISLTHSLTYLLTYLLTYSLIFDSDPLVAALVDAIIDEEIDMFTGLAVSKYKTRFGFNILEDDPQLVTLVRWALTYSLTN